MTHVERLGNLIKTAGSIVYFHEMVELAKQRLEEPVDTPDEVSDRIWWVNSYSRVLRMHREEYEMLRKAFSPEDKIAKALDNLIKECGA